MVSPSLEGSSADTYTFRVTLSVSDGVVSIKNVRRIAMRVPATPSLPSNMARTGFWFDVLDSTGTILYHFPLSHPTQQHIESFGDRPGDPMRRHPASILRSTFEVLVPDIPQAQSFRLHGPSIPNLTVLRKE